MDTEPEITDAPSLSWANDILSVYANMGTAAGRRKLGSTSAVALNRWVAESSENQTTFLKIMVPKAIEITQKHAKDDDTHSREVARFEKRAIDELQHLLREALAQ